MKQRIRPRADGSNLRLAADIGGTFTDIAVFDDRTGKLTFGKALSTPQRLVDGINAGVEKAGSDYRSAGLFLHGSTIAINTILERTGAKTALLITEGFRDIYEIGRINRPDAYNLYLPEARAAGRAGAALRGQGARARPTARSMTPLDEAEIAAFGRMLDGLGIEAIAILFLNCYARHDHEARAKAILEQEPSRRCSSPPRTSCRRNIASSSAARRWWPTPISGRWSAAISARSTTTSASEGFDGSFLIVQSTGGPLRAPSRRKNHCVRMLESGPAAGVIGTQALCHALGLENAIAFDMGGTTAKAGVIHKGEALTTGAALIGGYDKALPVQIAMMDIFEVGTGGGSIARVEDGALRVGPQSAGAAAGPGLLRPRRRASRP